MRELTLKVCLIIVVSWFLVSVFNWLFPINPTVHNVPQPQTTYVQQTPWYCQSLANLKQFQEQNPTLGVWCNPGPTN